MREEEDGLNSKIKNNDNNREETEIESVAELTRLALSKNRRLTRIQKRIRTTR